MEGGKKAIGDALFTLNADDIFIGHNPKNVNSAKVIQKLEFHSIGTQFMSRQGCIIPDIVISKLLHHEFIGSLFSVITETAAKIHSIRRLSRMIPENEERKRPPWGEDRRGGISYPCFQNSNLSFIQLLARQKLKKNYFPLLAEDLQTAIRSNFITKNTKTNL